MDSFEIRVKYMQNVKIHVFSRNLTEHVRYVWDTSRYIRIRVSCRIHAGYIRIRILITNPPRFDNKPPVTPTPHHSPASAVVVTVMATAPGRGSSEGASPTASVTALLRVPGGTEVSGFGTVYNDCGSINIRINR